MRKFTGRTQMVGASGASVGVSVYTYNVKCVPVLGYVSQLFNPPDTLPAVERNMMNTVLHLATNSLGHTDFFALLGAGGPSLRSPCVAAKAAMFRTATVTIKHWADWKVQLIDAAYESLPIARANSGKYFCDFWDGPPIALNLGHAAGGFPGDARWAEGARMAIQEIRDRRAALEVDRSSSQPPVQAIAYRNLLSKAFPSSLEVTVLKRLVKMRLVDPTQTTIPEFQAACAVMRNIRKHDALCVIKTWVNSWCTSYRYQEKPPLPCLLGCQLGKDDLSHYVDCIQIQLALDDLILSPPSNPLERIGLQNISRDSILTASAVFSGYHAIKRSHFTIGLSGSPLSTEQAIASQRIFAEAFQAAADDAGLPCRSAGRFVPFFEKL